MVDFEKLADLVKEIKIDYEHPLRFEPEPDNSKKVVIIKYDPAVSAILDRELGQNWYEGKNLEKQKQ